MAAVDAADKETVTESDEMFVSWAFQDFEDFDLIQSRFFVDITGLDNFDSEKLAQLDALAQPNGREMSPAQLLDDLVVVMGGAGVIYVSELHRVVAANFVVVDVFFVVEVLLLLHHGVDFEVGGHL